MEWQEILALVLGILLLIAGGYIKKLVKEIKEAMNAVKDLVDTFSDAIDDQELTMAERVALADKVRTLMKEFGDVKNVVIEIIGVIARRKTTR